MQTTITFENMNEPVNPVCIDKLMDGERVRVDDIIEEIVLSKDLHGEDRENEKRMCDMSVVEAAVDEYVIGTLVTDSNEEWCWLDE